MSLSCYNSLANPPPARPIVDDDDNLFENTPPQQYDINSYISVPKRPLEDWLIRLEPLVPSIHGPALVKAFIAREEDPIFYPSGVPYKTTKEVYKWIESQRRRSNLLLFAIIWKETNSVAGTVSICCDPTQGTLDVRVLAGKVFPEYRRRGIITHTSWLQLCYLLDPVEKGGLGLVRVTWRCVPENKESAGAAVKCGYTYEGTMRSYTVYGPGSNHKYVRQLADNTGRVVEDGLVFSLTTDDWLTGGKRERLRKLIEQKEEGQHRSPALMTIPSRL